MSELAHDTSRTPASPAPATTTVVPDLIGLGLADALATAAWAGTSVNATRVVRTREPWGVIVAQSPSPGTHLNQLWRIHVLVAEPPSRSSAPAEAANAQAQRLARDDADERSGGARIRTLPSRVVRLRPLGAPAESILKKRGR